MKLCVWSEKSAQLSQQLTEQFTSKLKLIPACKSSNSVHNICRFLASLESEIPSLLIYPNLKRKKINQGKKLRGSSMNTVPVK